MTAGTLLAQLLAATPAPPASKDLEGLLAMADTMVRDRDAILAAATAPLTITTSVEAAQLAQLQTRQRAWNTILEGARQQLTLQRLGAGKVRAYAATLAGSR